MQVVVLGNVHVESLGYGAFHWLWLFFFFFFVCCACQQWNVSFFSVTYCRYTDRQTDIQKTMHFKYAVLFWSDYPVKNNTIFTFVLFPILTWPDLTWPGCNYSTSVVVASFSLKYASRRAGQRAGRESGIWSFSLTLTFLFLFLCLLCMSTVKCVIF